MFKRILISLSVAFALLLSALPAMSAPAAPAVATAVAPTALLPSRAVYVTNSLYSTVSVKMCTGHNGTGKCYTVPRNSKSPVKVKSVYAAKYRTTMVGSRFVLGGTYWNTGVLSISTAVVTI